MQYRTDRHGEKISILGFGCMRFIRKGTGIDMEEAQKEIMTAIEQGVNYFDTAYIYPGSEVCLGRILQKNGCRRKINIATKLPQYLIGNRQAIDKYFNEELSRLKTDYIDYYLMHMLTDIAAWEKLEKLGVREWIAQKKQCGAIRNIGFSFHGNTSMFIKILNAYDWDFCQIQYNYMDENSQAGVKGLKAAAEKNIPVIIMEPLRGGKLVNMIPEKALRVMRESKRKWTPAEWGLRWLWNQPEVTCVLSGMNSLDMVKENIAVADSAKAGNFTQEDFEVLENVKRVIGEKMKVGCTGCNYCMPCPSGVDIPGTFRCYNEMYIEKKSIGRREYAQVNGLRKNQGYAVNCISCGKCENHCPQHLPIRKALKNADRDLRPWYYRAGVFIARKFMLRQ